MRAAEASPSPLAGEGLGRGGAVASIGCGVVLCADARCFGVGVRPTAEILSFASPKESIQRKGDPTFAPFATLRVPCASSAREKASSKRQGAKNLAFRAMRRLRNSRWPFRPSLKQSSPTTPFQPAMLGALDGSLFVVAPTASLLSAFFSVGSKLPTLPTPAKSRPAICHGSVPLVTPSIAESCGVVGEDCLSSRPQG